MSVAQKIKRASKLGHRDDPRTALVDRAGHRHELRNRIEGYEKKFGMKSHEVHRAIDQGRLEEDQEVCHWLIDYDLWLRVRSR